MDCFLGQNQKSPDPRTTDDKFLMEFEVNGNTKKIKKILKKQVQQKLMKKNKMMKRIFYNIGIFTGLQYFSCTEIQTIIQDLNICLICIGHQV